MNEIPYGYWIKTADKLPDDCLDVFAFKNGIGMYITFYHKNYNQDLEPIDGGYWDNKIRGKQWENTVSSTSGDRVDPDYWMDLPDGPYYPKAKIWSKITE